MVVPFCCGVGEETAFTASQALSKDHRQGARLRRVSDVAPRHPLSSDLPRCTLAPIEGAGGSRGLLDTAPGSTIDRTRRDCRPQGSLEQTMIMHRRHFKVKL